MRAFCRKTYTHTRTRVFWKCAINDQYTAEKCDNRVTIDEVELLEAICRYFESLIGDRQAFIQSVLCELEKKQPAKQNDITVNREGKVEIFLQGIKD